MSVVFEVDSLISAQEDTAVITLGDLLRRRLSRVLVHGEQQGTLRDGLTQGVNGLNGDFPSSGADGMPGLETPFLTDNSKRLLVERLEICDSFLACHVLQGCLHDLIAVCAVSVSGSRDRSAARELEEWLVYVLSSILHCLGKARNEQTTRRRLRCAIFLLQLCSTILKSERGASHPERAKKKPLAVANDRRRDQEYEGEFARDGTNRKKWEVAAASKCAEVTGQYVGRIIEALSIAKAEGTFGKAEVVGEHKEANVAFWATSLLSDVLKHARRRNQCFNDRDDAIRMKIETPGGRESTAPDPSVHPSKPLVANGAGASIGDGPPPNVFVNHNSQHGGLDICSLAKAVFDIHGMSATRAVDLSLKCLEVIELLLEAAEEKWRNPPAIFFTGVPLTLWRLSGHVGSLMPQEEQSRAPGSALVEVGGADGALAQTMLGIVFKLILVQSRQSGEGRGKQAESHEERDGHGREWDGVVAAKHHPQRSRRRKPWSTAAEALMATVATSCVTPDGDSYLQFAGKLVRLFFDQDDALVDMLHANLRIFHIAIPQDCAPVADSEGLNRNGLSPSLRDIYRDCLHPAALFAALMSELRYDADILLDWLVSPETCFLPYMTLLLRTAVANWSEFAARVSGARPIIDGNGTEEGREDDDDDYHNDGNDDDDDREDALVLSDEQAERLGMVMSCLSELVANLRALQKKALVPYNVTPLLRRMAQVVELYEECGDACDSTSEVDPSNNVDGTGHL